MKLTINNAPYPCSSISDLDEKPWAENREDTLVRGVHDTLTQWFEGEHISIKTSGTTGQPKTIYLSPELICWSAENTQKFLNLNQAKVLLCIPLNKVGGLMVLIRALIYNWDIDIVTPSSNPFLNSELYFESYNLTSLTPFQLANTISNLQSKNNLSFLTHVLVGGGTISEQLEQKIQNFSKESPTLFYHTYGMTETASHIAFRKINSQGRPYFTLVDGVKITTDKNDQLEISIPHFKIELKTSDQVKIRGNQLRFIGRSDEVVNSGGIKLNMNAIENLLSREILLSEFILWKEEDSRLGEILVMMITNKLPLGAVLEAFKALNKYEKPKKIYQISEITVTQTDKRSRINTYKSKGKLLFSKQ